MYVDAFKPKAKGVSEVDPMSARPGGISFRDEERGNDTTWPR
jgi:hypothetical protein